MSLTVLRRPFLDASYRALEADFELVEDDLEVVVTMNYNFM